MAGKHTAPGDQPAGTGSQPEAEEEGHRATTAPRTHTPGADRDITADGALSVGVDGGAGARSPCAARAPARGWRPTIRTVCVP